MTRLSHWLSVATIITVLSPAALAGSRAGWDGTWVGAWGGQRATSITISKDKVVSYTYEGGPATPVTRSRVTAKRVVYGDNGIHVVLTRTGQTTAFATLRSSQGNATAKLTRQR